MTDSPTIFDVIPAPKAAEDLPLPDPAYLVVSKNGLLVHKKTALGRVLAPVSSASFHNDIPPTLWTSEMPKMPAPIIGQAWAFFRNVLKDLHSEAAAYILTDSQGGYRLFIPNQEVSYVSVEHKLNLDHVPEGWTALGTIHSHCDFGAFHSGTDLHDADGMDGIHFTLGQIDKDEPQIAVMVSFNKVQWHLKPEDTIDGEVTLQEYPEFWHKFVKKETFSYVYTGLGYQPKGHTRALRKVDEKDDNVITGWRKKIDDRKTNGTLHGLTDDQLEHALAEYEADNWDEELQERLEAWIAEYAELAAQLYQLDVYAAISFGSWSETGDIYATRLTSLEESTIY